MFPGKITRDHAARSRRRLRICPGCSLNIGWLTRLATPTAGFTFGRARRLCSNTLSRSCLARWPIILPSKTCPPGSLRCWKGRHRSLAAWVDRIDAISNGGKKPKNRSRHTANIAVHRTAASNGGNLLHECRARINEPKNNLKIS